MSNCRPTFSPLKLYFITTSAHKHLHIFRDDIINRILLDTLDCYRHRYNIKLYYFVIMPNHLHFIIQFSEEMSLPNFMRDFKKHTADRIIRHLKATHDQKTLESIKTSPSDKRQAFQVWEAGYNAKDIFSRDFLEQKKDYIHHNPCRPPWNICDKPKEYPWSSARFYHTDQPCIIPIDDARELFE